MESLHPTNLAARPAPICGILSVVLTPAALLFALIAGAVFKPVAAAPPGGVGRVIVSLGKVLIFAAWGLGAAALLRRERPHWLPLAGWLSSGFIIGLLRFLDKDG